MCSEGLKPSLQHNKQQHWVSARTDGDTGQFRLTSSSAIIVHGRDMSTTNATTVSLSESLFNASCMSGWYPGLPSSFHSPIVPISPSMLDKKIRGVMRQPHLLQYTH